MPMCIADIVLRLNWNPPPASHILVAGMRIVLTNDDGYGAPGIRALWEAIRSLGGDIELSIIAPSDAYSGKGHAVSPSIRCWPTELDGIGRVVAVDGTPADCVRVAVALPGEPHPDVVLSGINRGSNVGIDLYYSGTVAAAREAAMLGIRGIAISQHVRPDNPDNWTRTTRQAAAVLDALLRPAVPAPEQLGPLADAARRALQPIVDDPPPRGPFFWNVNLPSLPPDCEPAEVLLVPPGTDGLMIRYEHFVEEEVHALNYTGVYHDRPASPGSDVATVFGGSIAISRVPV
jgi:5'-nucleotidase